MNKLTVIEHNDIKVLTTEQLAQVYETEVKNIQKNFSNNCSRFQEGVHYYKLEGNALNDFRNLPPNISGGQNMVISNKVRVLYLWTEKGCNRHCKILDTDKAWEQFEVLEETYFKVKEMKTNLDSYMIVDPVERAKRWIEEYEQRKALEQVVEQQTPLAILGERIEQSEDTYDVSCVANVLNIKGLGRTNFFKWLRTHRFLQRNNNPYREIIEQELMEVTLVNTAIGEKFKPLFTGKGIVKVVKLLQREGRLQGITMDDILEKLGG